MIVWREKSMSKLRTLAIIPAYNEALNIEKNSSRYYGKCTRYRLRDC